MSAEKTVHDWLLANKPDDASHEMASCKFCKEPDQEKEEVAEGDKIFTQEQHEQLLASAIEKARKEATASVDAEVLKLNERVMAFEKEADEKDAKIKDLESEINARDEKARLDALASERAKLVQAEVNFSDEQIEARKAQWAALSEGDFKAYLDDIREVAKVNGGKKEEKKDDGKASFDGTRSTAGENKEEVDVIKDFFGVVPALVGKI